MYELRDRINLGPEEGIVTETSSYEYGAPPVRGSSVASNERSHIDEAEEYAHSYAALARGLDCVRDIYVDLTDGLTIYTVYEGNFREATDALYDIYDRVMDMFPGCLAKYRLIGAASGNDDPLPSSARRVA